MIAFWVFQVAVGGGAVNYPYAGIILFLILPGIFLIGLIMMPAGIWLRHRRLRARGELPVAYPQVDLNNPGFRKAASLVAYATIINVAICTVASYRGVQYMDSVHFCGTTCHTVMQPEYTAYLNSPHSRVTCVQCHIGPGASWFVRSKLSGVKQVFAVMLDDYPRPILSPIESLRPARATCEKCHWPQRFLGNPIVVINHYAEDKDNTSSTTVLAMRVGGQNGTEHEGIHGAHMNPGVRITYVALDAKLQVIPQVTYTDPSGKMTVFNSTDLKATPAQLAAGEDRVMDCMDCHNRPTHTFQLPGDALDQAMSRGLISTDLPFIKKQTLAALKVKYPDRQTAEKKIAESLDKFYQANYPDVVASRSVRLDAAIRDVQLIYSRNVFPKMDVSWGTYINDLGHMNWPGCFRCHDGSHVSKDGKTIPNDCETCHHILAMDEHNPKVLADLGIK
jgi:nitrate/TMAO reductase-like tetraheme cytochrome c subunit